MSAELFADLKILSEDPEVQGTYLAFPRLQAVIIAVALLPRDVEVEEWFPLLSQSVVGNVSFSNEALATKFAVTLTQCIEGISDQISGNEPVSLLLENEGDKAQFAETFFDVTYHYHEQWDAFVEHADEETEGLFQTTQLLICKLAKIMADDPEQQALFEQLPCEDEIVKVLPTLLSVLGNRSKSL